MRAIWRKIKRPTLEVGVSKLIPKRERQHVGCEEQSQVKDQPVLAGVLKAAVPGGWRARTERFPE